MAGNRISRIEEEVKRVLADIIRTEVKDDRLSEMTSVTKVEITSDLKYAKVFVSVYGTEKTREASVDALNHGASFIRTRLAKMVDLRRVPELAFYLDDSIEYSLKIAKLLNEVRQKD